MKSNVVSGLTEVAVIKYSMQGSSCNEPEFNASTYFCFIDLHKAYDSVNRNALWKVLQKSYKLSVKMIRIIQSLHDGTNGVVRFEGQVSSEFPIESGVKQGDVMAPLLINLF